MNCLYHQIYRPGQDIEKLIIMPKKNAEAMKHVQNIG